MEKINIDMWHGDKPERFRTMHGGIIKHASRSRRPAGLYGRRMRTVAGSFIADQMRK